MYTINMMIRGIEVLVDWHCTIGTVGKEGELGYRIINDELENELKEKPLTLNEKRRIVEKIMQAHVAMN